MADQRPAQAKQDRPWYTYPPNILTCFRFVLIIPVVACFMTDRRILSLIFYVIATLTDLVDGKIARKYDMISNWGKVMDPLADKLLLLAVIVCMYLKGDLSLPIIIIVFSKELIMIIGGIVLYGASRLVVPSNIVGKIGTVLFSIAVILTFLKNDIAVLAKVYEYCMWLAVAFSVFSMLQYGYLLLRRRIGEKNEKRA